MLRGFIFRISSGVHQDLGNQPSPRLTFEFDRVRFLRPSDFECSDFAQPEVFSCPFRGTGEISGTLNELAGFKSMKGATGFDWIMRGLGSVPWLISWPRKKLIKKQLLTSR